MSAADPIADVPAGEQPTQANGQQQDEKDQQQLTNDMFHDEPTPSKTVNHIYNYPVVHDLCSRLLEWTLPRWGYLITEAYAQKVVKPVVGVGLKLPGADVVTRVADTIDGYSNNLLNNVDVMFPITTKSTQHNWEDAKSAMQHVKDTFSSDLKKMGDTMPNRAKAALTATIKCGSEAVVSLSDSIIKASAKANQFVQDGTNKLRSNGIQALDDAKKMGQQFVDDAKNKGQQLVDDAKNKGQQLVDDAKKKLTQAQDKVQDVSKNAQETVQSTAGNVQAQANAQVQANGQPEDAQQADK